MVSLFTQTQNAFARYGIAPVDLRWSGRPATGLLFRRSDLFAIPSGLIWLALVVVFVFASGGRNASRSFDIVGIAFATFFLVVGIYTALGHFLSDAFVRSRTFYGLTADSALIVVNAFGSRITRLYLPAVKTIRLDLRGYGRGTIGFGEPSYKGFVWPVAGLVPSFEAIPDAQRVYDMCIQAQRANQSSTSG